VIPNTKSMLGEVMLGQKQYTKAEPLLVGSAEQLLAHHLLIPTTERFILQRAIDRVVEYYTATGNVEKAAEWRNRTIPPAPKLRVIPPAVQ